MKTASCAYCKAFFSAGGGVYIGNDEALCEGCFAEFSRHEFGEIYQPKGEGESARPSPEDIGRIEDDAAQAGAVVKITSFAQRPCGHCGASDFMNFSDVNAYFEGAMNHYVGAHGFEILHVGQETHYDAEGQLWQSTVAVLARAK